METGIRSAEPQTRNPETTAATPSTDTKVLQTETEIDRVWYVIDKQHQIRGGFTKDELVYFYQQTTSNPNQKDAVSIPVDVMSDTLIWKHGMQSWMPIASCLELKVPEDGPAVANRDVEVVGSRTDVPRPTEDTKLQEDVFEETFDYQKQLRDVEPEDMLQGLQVDSVAINTKRSLNQFARQLDDQQKQQIRTKRERQALKRKLQSGNTSIYITNLPKDEVDERELEGLFSKCGIIKLSENKEPKVKRYTDQDGKWKDDALVTFVFDASVENAIMIYDDYEIRPKQRIAVQRARFEVKGEAVEAILEQKRKKRSLQQSGGSAAIFADSMLPVQQRELANWDDDEMDGSKGSNAHASRLKGGGYRIVILKNVFDHEQQAKSAPSGEAAFYQDLYERLWAYCQEQIGPLEKLVIFQKSELGAVSLRFKKASDAVRSIQAFHLKPFLGRTLVAEFFDGKTDYRVKETEEEAKERNRKWEEWLALQETHVDKSPGQE